MNFCGNCGTELEKLSDTEFYCSKCDETFQVSSGKQKVTQKKNLLEQLKEIGVRNSERLEKLEKSQQRDDSLSNFTG